MADEQAKNSANLGELFVEFGSKGMGGLIKGLNSVSASFLLTKNAAQQMLSPLANMSKQAGQGVVAWDKWNAVTGISDKRLQDLSRWAKINNIEVNDYLAQVQKMQQTIIELYKGNPQQLFQATSMLGIDPTAFDYKNPLKNIEIIKRAMLKMYKERGEAAKPEIANALNMLGVNEELAYVLLKQNREIDKSLNLTDKQIDQLRKQNDAWNDLKDASGQFFSKAISEAEWFKNIIKGTTDIFKILIHNMDDYNRRKEQGNVSKEEKDFRGILKFMGIGGTLAGIGTGAMIGAASGAPAGGVGAIPGALIGGLIGGVVGGGAGFGANAIGADLLEKVAKDQNKKRKSNQQLKKSLSQNILPNTTSNIIPQSMATSGIPNVTRNNVDNRVSYEVNIHQEITGTDSLEIADNSVSGIENTMIQLKYGNIG